ncbi:MAG: hypothetical protein K8F30_07805 [Taibaiella sp.]|nr:hypothetical protein [Taibaiella sp.]
MCKENTNSNLYTKDEQGQINADIQSEYNRIMQLPEVEVRMLLAETNVDLKWLHKSFEKIVDAVAFIMESQAETVHTLNRVIKNEPTSPIQIGGSLEEVQALKKQTQG